MSRQITRLFDVVDGKRYFILQVEKSGNVHSGIVKAKVTLLGHPIVKDQCRVCDAGYERRPDAWVFLRDELCRRAG